MRLAAAKVRACSLGPSSRANAPGQWWPDENVSKLHADMIVVEEMKIEN